MSGANPAVIEGAQFGSSIHTTCLSAVHKQHAVAFDCMQTRVIRRRFFGFAFDRLLVVADGIGMALGWLEKMLWFNPAKNITVVSMGYVTSHAIWILLVIHGPMFYRLFVITGPRRV